MILNVHELGAKHGAELLIIFKRNGLFQFIVEIVCGEFREVILWGRKFPPNTSDRNRSILLR
jgi:hypothetical protein